MNKYLIIPGCSDLNRGDQALAWQTKKFAEKCGYQGDFYLLSEKGEPFYQTVNEGMKPLTPILEHPSRKCKDKINTIYTVSLKLRWGCIAFFDFLYSILVLYKPTRCLIKHFLNAEKKKTLDIFGEAEAIFVKGGGLFQTYGGLSSTYAMYFWCFHIFLAHAFEKDIYMMPNSLGPFEGPFVKRIIKSALTCCKVIAARETLSEEVVMKQLGLEICTYPDLAFGLESSNLSKSDIFKKYNLQLDRKIVALTMRPFRFPKSDYPEQAYEKFKNEIRAFIVWLYDHGFLAVIVEHTRALNSHENDSECINEVIKGIDNYKYRYISDYLMDCRDLKALYGMFDYIVGTRFHSVVFSFGSNVPGIAISYSGNKAQGIMKDIGLSEYIVSIYDVTAECLEKKLEELIENEESVIDKIKSYNYKVDQYMQRLISECRKGE